MRLDLVPNPVADVDRAKAFYADKLGLVVDLDEWTSTPTKTTGPVRASA